MRWLNTFAKPSCMTGLDPDARHILHGLLLEQKRDGVAIILASHDVEDRQVLADKVWSL